MRSPHAQRSSQRGLTWEAMMRRLRRYPLLAHEKLVAVVGDGVWIAR
jgi:hypothetical protein